MRHFYDIIQIELENQFRYRADIGILKNISKNYKEDSEEYSAIQSSIRIMECEANKWEEFLLEQMREIMVEESKYQDKKKKESEEFSKSLYKMFQSTVAENE